MAKFKEYNQNQMMLLPPSLEEKIKEDHIARLISQVVDKLDIRDIEARYSEEGCSAYHPRMLLKIILYGYSIGIRGSRRLQKRTEEDIVFMWLSGMQNPDFRTISDFRKDKLGDIKKLFKQVLGMCFELGMTNCGKVSLDGTKIEASSNRNKVTYKKSLIKRKARLEEQIDKIFDEAEEIDRQEDEMYGEWDGYSTGRKISEEEIEKAVEKLNKERSKLNKDKAKKQDKLDQVTDKIAWLEARNSSGNTDKDATLMQMKEGYLGVGYNMQMVTENQVILDYGLYQRPADVKLMQEVIEGLKDFIGKSPEAVIADKGYSSQANYEYLESEKIKAVIPHCMYEQDKRAKRLGTYKPSQNKEFQIYKDRNLEYLESAEGKALMKKRQHDVEPVFGNIKYNMNFRKLILRMIPKAVIEVGLISMAHNIQKMKKALEMGQTVQQYT
jgi:transposase